MAQSFVSFFNSRYAKLRHGTIDPHFLQTYLLPELARQGPLGIGSPGIELPHGTNEAPEYITLQEAKSLVINFLIEDCNLSESEQKQISKTLRLSDFATLATQIITRTQIAPAHRASMLSPDTLSSLQTQSTPPVNDPKTFQSDALIKQYNELYLQLLPHTRSLTSLQHLAHLCPTSLQQSTHISPSVLMQIILSHLPELTQAQKLYPDPTHAAYHLAQTFATHLDHSPATRAYSVFLNDESIQQDLYQLISHLGSSISPQLLSEYSRTQKQVGANLARYLPNHSELQQSLERTLPFTNPTERKRIAKQILAEVIKGTTNPEATLDTILSNLKLDSDLSLQIKSTLQNSGQDLTLQYYQGELRYLLGQRVLTKSELKLLKKGINPFLASVEDNLLRTVINQHQILQQYNRATNQHFSSIEEAYVHAQQNPTQNSLLFAQLRALTNQKNYFNSLSHQEKTLVRSTRISNYYLNNFTRIPNLNRQFTSILYQVNDGINTLTGKNFILKAYTELQKRLDKVTYHGIPIFRLRLWVIENWNKWLRQRIDKLILISEKWHNYYGRLFHRSLTYFKLGDYSLSGGFRVWSKRATSLIALKTASLIVKKGTPTLTRAFLRTLIKIGGKTLAKAGQLGLDALVSVSGVGTVIGIILLVKDAIGLAIGMFKWLWNKFKNLFPSTEAALAGLIAGFTIAIGSFGTFIIGFLSPVLMGTILPLGLVFSLTFGGTYLFQYLTEQTDFGTHLDSNSSLTQLAISIICNQDGNSSNNPTANVALCIAKLAYECPGINPMTKEVVNSPKWQCLVKNLIFKKAIRELEISSEISNFGNNRKNVQCVGLDNAAAADGDGAFSTGQKHACSYATINLPKGYKYLPGCPNMQPGDHFIIGVENCITNGGNTVGHIGVVIEPNGGEKFTCVDANYSLPGNGVLPGEIRGPDKCYFAKSKISGCLRKI